MTRVDEIRLVESHRAGDAEAFPEIVREFYASLFLHALRRLVDVAAAEDAVQETFLRAYRALPRLNGELLLGAWLHRILENVCADEGNRRRRENEVAVKAGSVAIIELEGPEAELDRIALRHHVNTALEALSPSYREALTLRYMNDLTYREVASAAGISEDNARARVHRARAALKGILGGLLGVLAFLLAPFRRIQVAFAEVRQAAAGPALEAVTQSKMVLVANLMGTIGAAAAPVLPVLPAVPAIVRPQSSVSSPAPAPAPVQRPSPAPAPSAPAAPAAPLPQDLPAAAPQQAPAPARHEASTQLAALPARGSASGLPATAVTGNPTAAPYHDACGDSASALDLGSAAGGWAGLAQVEGGKARFAIGACGPWRTADLALATFAIGGSPGHEVRIAPGEGGLRWSVFEAGSTRAAASGTATRPDEATAVAEIPLSAIGGARTFTFRITVRDAAGGADELPQAGEPAAAYPPPGCSGTVLGIARGQEAQARSSLDSAGIKVTGEIRELGLLRTNAAPDAVRSLAASGRLRGVAWHEAAMPRFLLQAGAPEPGEASARFGSVAPAPGTAAARIAVIDTGAGRAGSGLLPTWDAVSSQQAGGDGDRRGHGSAVAALMPKGAEVLPVRVDDLAGSICSFGVASAVHQAAAWGAGVIAMSLGGDGASRAEREAVSFAQSRGALVVAAGGNAPDQARGPAAYEGVLGVGALSGERRASYSVAGAHIDLVAPGGGPAQLPRAPAPSPVATALATPDASPMASAAAGGPSPKAAAGTSFAAARVAAAAAVLRGAAPDLKAEGLAALLAATARDLGPAGRDDEHGAGALDLERALEAVTRTIRISGADRYATAIALSKAVFPKGASVAVVSSGESVPDALAAGPLAASFGGPLLLAPRSGVPGKALEEELARLKVAKVVVLGGEAAVAGALDETLARLGIDVRRLAGGDRFETATLAATTVGAAGGIVFLSGGDSLADALPAGALAGAMRAPLLLTGRDALSQPASAALDALGAGRVVIVGGESSVGPDVAAELEAGGKKVERISGPDRYSSSRALAGWAAGEGLRFSEVVATGGESLFDAVAAAAAAGVARVPMIMVARPGSAESAADIEWLALNAARIARLVIVGGDEAVPAEVRVRAGAALAA